MIHQEVNKFMALAPLMFPTLINGKQMVESEISENYAVLNFMLEESYPMSYVMEVLSDDLDLNLLYHAANVETHHVCYFTVPHSGNLMYKINFQTKAHDYVEHIIVTVYSSLDLWEEDLELDIKHHQEDFTFIAQMENQEILSLFCKINYED